MLLFVCLRFANFVLFYFVGGTECNALLVLYCWFVLFVLNWWLCLFLLWWLVWVVSGWWVYLLCIDFVLYCLFCACVYVCDSGVVGLGVETAILEREICESAVSGVGIRQNFVYFFDFWIWVGFGFWVLLVFVIL